MRHALEYGYKESPSSYLPRAIRRLVKLRTAYPQDLALRNADHALTGLLIARERGYSELVARVGGYNSLKFAAQSSPKRVGEGLERLSGYPLIGPRTSPADLDSLYWGLSSLWGYPQRLEKEMLTLAGSGSIYPLGGPSESAAPQVRARPGQPTLISGTER